MLRTMTLALLAFALTGQAALAATACAGADPSITSVVVKSVSSTGGTSSYQLSGTVVNNGSQGQASNVLQFVDISQTGARLDAKTIPPLKAGESYTFSYVAQRSADAGKGTTKLDFQLDMHQPASPGAENCSASDDAFTLTF